MLTGAIGSRGFETGHRRHHHHVASPAQSDGRHVRRPSARSVEGHLVGEFHTRLLVHRVPRKEHPVCQVVFPGNERALNSNEVMMQRSFLGKAQSVLDSRLLQSAGIPHRNATRGDSSPPRLGTRFSGPPKCHHSLEQGRSCRTSC